MTREFVGTKQTTQTARRRERKGIRRDEKRERDEQENRHSTTEEE